MLKVTIKTVFLVVLPFLFSSKRFKLITTEYKYSNFKLCVRHLECFERDKKRYPRQKTMSGTKNDIRDKKRYQGDISFLCPPIIDLIKAQVCDKICYSAHSPVGLFSGRLHQAYNAYF